MILECIIVTIAACALTHAVFGVIKWLDNTPLLNALDERVALPEARTVNCPDFDRARLPAVQEPVHVCSFAWGHVDGCPHEPAPSPTLDRAFKRVPCDCPGRGHCISCSCQCARCYKPEPFGTVNTAGLGFMYTRPEPTSMPGEPESQSR